jgi:predicted aldo/keto reductase-like oxidoreductase
MEAVARAVDAGKVRHVGVSSHNLAMAKRLVDSGLFATVQYPFSVVEDAAGLELIPPACARGMAVLAMKPFGGGMIGSAGLAFAYLRQFPEVVPLAGFDSVAGVDEVCDIYDRPSGVGPDEEAAFARLRAELGKRFCRRCEYCQPCPQGVMITPAMLYKVVAHRMSPAKAMNFSAKAMESVRACVQCGECAGRCPYDLPIPDMLAEHLEMYDRHKAECGGAG